MHNMMPTAAPIDQAIDVLSILELAKDATKLKAALVELKTARDAAASERERMLAEQANLARASGEAADAQRKAELALSALDQRSALLDDRERVLERRAAELEGSMRARETDCAQKVESALELAAERERVAAEAVDKMREARSLEEGQVAGKLRELEAQKIALEGAQAAALAAERAALATKADFEGRITRLQAMAATPA